jgi:hypothetical protein
MCSIPLRADVPSFSSLELTPPSVAARGASLIPGAKRLLIQFTG